MKKGCEFVFKIISKGVSEKTTARELGTIEEKAFSFARPKVFLRAENDQYHFMVQQKAATDKYNHKMFYKLEKKSQAIGGENSGFCRTIFGLARRKLRGLALRSPGLFRWRIV